MKTARFLSAAIVAAGCMLTFAGCSTGNSGPFEDLDEFDANVMSERLDSYYQKDNTEVVYDDTLRVYIDFSDGMVNAYKGNANNLDMIKALANKFTTKAQFFKMAAGTISPMDFSFNEIFNKVTDPKSYSKEIMAPIEETVKQITAGNAEALVVTDFEEYTTDKKVQKRAYADKYFKEWIEKGNTVTFYIANFTEKKVEKHLYFTVFSTPDGRLNDLLNEAWDGRGLEFQTFSLTTDFYAMSTKYPSVKQGGEYIDNEGNSIIMAVDGEHYVNASDKGYEYYPCLAPWGDIIANAKAMMEPGVPKPFSHVFRNLFVNFTNTDSYDVQGLSLNVTDVTEDFTFFVQCEEAKKHTPKMTKDASGNLIFAEDNDVVALSCYDEKGELRSEWKYTAKESQSIAEAFQIDAQLFDNTKKDTPENIEIGTMFHTNFDGSQIANPNALVRIDVVVDKCQPNLENLESMFSWEGNSSLLESVRNALQECNPKGKTIYSYFIRSL